MKGNDKRMLDRIGTVLIALLTVLLVTAPAIASEITHFNGDTADSNDQVSHLVVAQGQDGNVTVQFNNNSVAWGNLSTTVEINFTKNISSYSYTASGDTGNLTVTQNDWNLNFTNTNGNAITLSNVNMTFNYSTGLNNSEGIGTSSGDVMTSKGDLAFLSNNNGTAYNASNTTEKQTYIVYDANDIYNYDGVANVVGGNDSDSLTAGSGNFTIDMSDTDNDEVEFTHTLYRDTYGESLVPLYKSYFHLKLMYPNFTNMLIESVDDNTTEIGKTLNDYYTAKFLDSDVSSNNTVKVSAYAWDTNGTLDNGYKFSYDINPTGGLKTTPSHTKDVNVTKAAAAAAPTGLQYFLQYTVDIFGFELPLIYLIGLVLLSAVIGVLIWRWYLGFPVLGKVGASAFVALMAFGVISFIQQVVSDAWNYVSSNPIIMALAVILVILVIGIVVWILYKLATRY